MDQRRTRFVIRSLAQRRGISFFVKRCRGGGESLSPRPQFHPAQKRFEGEYPDDAHHQIEKPLGKHRPFADPRRQAGNNDRPDGNERQNKKHAGRFAPTGLGIHKRSPVMINSCSVKMASRGISQLSRGILSTSCTAQAMPMRRVAG